MTHDYKKLSRANKSGYSAKKQTNRKVQKSKAPKETLKQLTLVVVKLSSFIRAKLKDFQSKRNLKKPEPEPKFKKEPKYKVSLGKKKEEPKKQSNFSFGKFLLSFFRLPIFIFESIFGGVGKQLVDVSRATVLKLVFISIFAALIFNFIQLQVIANNGLTAREGSGMILSITQSTRGSIFIRDLQANNKPIEVTSSRVLFNVFFEPLNLKSSIERGSLTREEAITAVSGSLNLPRGDIEKAFNEELDKPTPSQYKVIQKFISKEQKEAVEHLRYYGYNTARNFSNWLGIEQVEVRSYPEEQFLGSLGSTLGYVQREPVTRDEATKIADCRTMIRENETRDTVNSFTGQDKDGRYTVGIYGIEQKFCSELGGLNGRQLLGSEVGTKTQEDVEVKHGSDIFLTIDKNMQLKAQEILDEVVRSTTNSQGGPVNGSVIILDMKDNPGAVLAMANYPFVDPNEYYKSINGFRNTATSVDYEAGSVVKPLTVAAALNEYTTGQVDKDGNRIGIPTTATFLGYDDKGKPYPENNGRTLYLRNADSMSYLSRGPQPISNCLRDSINTCIADIQPTIGNLKTKEYFENKYLLGQPTLISLPGDENGNVAPLQDNIYSDYTYAAFGFGQGFTISPLQLMRAYTPLANDGKLIEPYLVDKIVDSNNRIYESDAIDAPESIRQKAQIQVIQPAVAHEVTSYLVNTLDQGYLGNVHSKAQVPGYTVAGKTGTAQVSRAYKGTPCGYDCNTLRGIYDHTIIGYGPARDPEVMVLIKLSEPQPGVIRNYAENTLGPSFSKLMGWSLDYMGVPREEGR